MKVLHLLQSNRFSGAENVVCQIINMLKTEKDIEMFYCSTDGEIRDSLKERNIRFIPISKLSVSEVKKVINELKPDIIHAHDMKASFIASLTCGKIKLISHIHNNAFDSRGVSLKSLAYLYAAKKAKHIFWVSQSSFNGYVFHSIFLRKSTVLYNIIDIDALYQRMATDKNTYEYDVIYVGRLTQPKNPQRLMRVLKSVVEKMTDVKIAIIGTGELEEETKKLCCELNMNNNIEFLGFKNNPLKILYDAKVMIMTSRWEGTPMCALEAMALGVPIVSTPTDGLCELIEDGINGYLCDYDDGLSASIIRILNDHILWDRMRNQQIKMSLIINDINRYRNAILDVYKKCN